MTKSREKTMSFKGYFGSVECSLDDEILFGKLLYIRNTVSFEAATVPELRKAFEAAVDDYLEFCKSVGDEPDKPFSGTFNVRIAPDLHKQAVIAADSAGISLNKWVEEAIGMGVQHNHVTAGNYTNLPPVRFDAASTVKQGYPAIVITNTDTTSIGQKLEVH